MKGIVLNVFLLWMIVLCAQTVNAQQCTFDAVMYFSEDGSVLAMCVDDGKGGAVGFWEPIMYNTNKRTCESQEGIEWNQRKEFPKKNNCATLFELAQSGEGAWTAQDCKDLYKYVTPVCSCYYPDQNDVEAYDCD